jgi:hypothetical protein
MKEWLLKLIQDQWPVFGLFFLMMMLSATHAFMIHYNRPPAVINWCEGMITGTFTALIAKLK